MRDYIWRYPRGAISRKVGLIWRIPGNDRKPVELAGIVTSKRIEWTEVIGIGVEAGAINQYPVHYINVSGREFTIPAKFYNSVRVDEEVTITLETRWWVKLLPIMSLTDPFPTNRVRRIRRWMSPTTYPISTLAGEETEEAQAVRRELAWKDRELARHTEEECAVLQNLGVRGRGLSRRQL